MEFIIALIIGFFLSLKWITNKILLIEKWFKWDEVVFLRYLFALIFTLALIFFYPNEWGFSVIIILLIFLISLIDFIWTNLTQKYFKLHPNSSFQNFLWSFVSIVYIPIWYFILNEPVFINDLIWVFIIWVVVYMINSFKDLNLKSLLLLWIVLTRLGAIFFIWYYISLWWYFLILLISIYLFVLISYYLKFTIKPFVISKIGFVSLLDSLFFTIASIWSFYLFEILKSYEVKIYLLSTFFFNTILFYLFFKEKYILKKIILSLFIILWLIIMNLK